MVNIRFMTKKKFGVKNPFLAKNAIFSTKMSQRIFFFATPSPKYVQAYI